MQNPQTRPTWARVARALPLTLALTAVALVWLGGAVWSFEEQTRVAARLAFAVPFLLPLVLDGLAISLAGVAYAAALDGRAAIHARTMTALAVAASAASNAAGAWTRTDADPLAVTIAAGVPLAANIAFEVLLGELRRQVHRRRGLPAPAAIPHPRTVRLLLAPISTFKAWRILVLALTDPALTGSQPALAAAAEPPQALPRVPDDVLAAGRTIATQLAVAGTPLTHRALTDAYRATVGSIGSDTASALLKHLKADPSPETQTAAQDQTPALTNA